MKLLLHICCAPCLIFPLEQLKQKGFEVTGVFYNPNIHPFSEYQNRKQAVEDFSKTADIAIIYPDYNPTEFFRAVNLLYRKLNKGLSDTTGVLLRGVQAPLLRGDSERSERQRGWKTPMDKIVRERKRTPILIRGVFFCLLASLIIDNTGAQALDRRTAFTLSHYIMAGMYDSLGETDKAIQEYKRALKADYKNSVVHLKLASSYIKNNDTQRAIEELNLAVKFGPELVEPHAILALLYASQNKLDEASREYEIALQNASKLHPQNIDIYKSLGAIYLQQRKLKEAENVYKLILDLSADDAQAHFYLANVYYELKDMAKAEEGLKKAIELDPDYHEALNYLGYLYVEDDRNLEQAQILIRKALEMEPDNGAYVDSLGWLYFKQGKLKEAKEALERASLLLDDPVIYDHLGDVYLETDDKEKAKLNWQKSLELDSKQDSIKEKLDALH